MRVFSVIRCIVERSGEFPQRGLFLVEARMVIKWVTTPTCKECKFYDAKKKQCTLKQCAYKDKR